MNRARAAERQQRRAADPGASVWVAASAGSGKTKVLTDRVLTLLLRGSPPERILCLTFTRAAAAEMANRIHGTLGEWSVADEGMLRRSLARLLGEAPDDALLDEARRLFARVLETPGGLKVQTIHGFCESLLGRFPLEAGVAPHAEVLDERAAAELLTEARDTMLLGAAEDPDLGPALAQITGHVREDAFAQLVGALAAVRERLGEGVAAAGGIEGAVQRLAVLLDLAPGTGPEDVLAEAAADVAFDGTALRRAAAALEGGGDSDRERAARIARWLAASPDERRRLFPDYRGVFLTGSGTPRKQLATKGVVAASPGIDEVLAVEAERLVQVNRRHAAAITLRATEALLRLGIAMLDEYRAAKRRRARLDYDDLVHTARRLLGDVGAAWVLYKLDGGIDHVLIDESQDTSPEQWAVVAALVAEFFAGQGAREITRTVFAVGDVKQSIFSFQGADPAAAAAMRRRFRERVTAAGGDWREVPLYVSFRSTEPILRVVDAVFATSPAREGVVGEGETLRHEANRAGAAGRVELWPAIGPGERKDTEGWAPPVARAEAEDPAATLARIIAVRIAGWIDREPLEARGRAVRPGDIMVLVRRRSRFVELLVRELKVHGVPVAGVDRMVLTEQIAVMDLMALVRFLLLPEDDLTLAVVLKGPLVGLGEEDLFRLAHGRGSATLWRRLGDLAGEEPRFAAARAWLAGLLAEIDYLRPYEFLAQVLIRPAATGAESGRARMIARLGPEAEDPLDELLALALAYEREGAPSLQGFLQWFEGGRIEAKRDLEQARRDEVRVLTVHGAKGLEAPIVILPDTMSKPRGREPILWHEGLPLWPPRKEHEVGVAAAARAEADRRRDEEYRRLLYVAMTRAEDRLYVCGWHGRQKPPDDCWYNLVRAGLERLDGVETFDFGSTGDVREGRYGRGQRLVVAQRTAPEERAAERGAAAEPAPLPAWARMPAAPEPQPPRPLAPSRPIAAEPPPRSPLDAEDAGRRGRIVHRLLELLPGVAPEARREAGLRLLAASDLRLVRERRHALLDEVLAVLDNPEAADLFGPDSRAEVPLAGTVRLGGRTEVVSGRVDRLVVTAQAVRVVDFKTMRPAPQSAADVPHAYLRQMAAYRALLRKIWRDRPVVCALLWTEGPRLLTLDDQLLDRVGSAS